MRIGVLMGLLLALPSTVGAQSTWRVDPQPVLTRGGYGGDGKAVLEMPAGATRRADGSIVVADGTAPALRFFDSQGRLVQSVGRSGSGPGEYSVISWLGRCAGDSLVVYDLYQRRFSVLDAAGRFVRQFPASGSVSAISCASDGSMAVIGASGTTTGEDGRVRATVSVLNAAGGVRFSVPDVPYYEMASVGGVPIPHPLGPVTALALTRERLHLATGAAPAVDVYDATGRKSATHQLSGASRRPTAAHHAAGVQEFLRFTTDPAMRRAMESQLARLAPRAALPPYSAVLVDPDGYLWVHRSMPGDPTSTLTVLAPAGRIAAEVRLPVFARLFEVGRDYILGARENDDGEPEVVMWRLRR